MEVGIVGVGSMGQAFAKLFSGKHDLYLFGRSPQATRACATRFHANTVGDLKELCSAAKVVLIAVKPKDFPELAKELKPHFQREHLVVSIVAGYPLATLRKQFPLGEVVHLMPNLSLSVGKGVLALEEDSSLSDQARADLTRLLEPGGSLLWLPRAQVEAVSALAGSGLAFVFLMLEALTDAGVAMGLPAARAEEIAAQTVLGAAELSLRERVSLATLRTRVTSPGGTTIEGIRELEDRGARSAMIEAVLAAHRRAREIADV